MIEEFISSCGCHCANVTQAEAVNLVYQTILPRISDLYLVNGGWTENGYDQIVAHERRRVQVLKQGYETYLAPAQGFFAMRCGMICSSTPSEAKRRLEQHLENTRRTLVDQFDLYQNLQWFWISQENSFPNLIPVFPGNIVMDGFTYVHDIRAPLQPVVPLARRQIASPAVLLPCRPAVFL